MQSTSSRTLCMFLLTTSSYCHEKTYYTAKYITTNHCSGHVFDPHTLIVWVHGTRFMQSHEFKTIFKKSAQLKKADTLSSVRYYEKICRAFTGQHSFNHDNLYFFGWSGKLCNKERKRCALELYNALYDLKKNYEKAHNISPTIVLIGHSHGGNVILHMASYHTAQTHFIIDKVVLLACPAQDRMYYYLHSSLFKKIYSLYSYRDIIQILAPNFLKKRRFPYKNSNVNPFSRRMFPPQQNLIQSRVILNGNGPRHNDFVKKPFLSILPTLVMHMETWNTHNEQKRYLTYVT